MRFTAGSWGTAGGLMAAVLADGGMPGLLDRQVVGEPPVITKCIGAVDHDGVCAGCERLEHQEEAVHNRRLIGSRDAGIQYPLKTHVTLDQEQVVGDEA